MKKLFISCPMKGRTEGNIGKSMEKMHKIAELIFDEELEVIPTYIENKAPANKNEALWCLGESIKKMAEADYFIGVDIWDFKGCMIEFTAAREYGIPHYIINDPVKLMPDMREIRIKQDEPLKMEELGLKSK